MCKKKKKIKTNLYTFSKKTMQIYPSKTVQQKDQKDQKDPNEKEEKRQQQQHKNHIMIITTMMKLLLIRNNQNRDKNILISQ